MRLVTALQSFYSMNEGHFHNDLDIFIFGFVKYTLWSCDASKHMDLCYTSNLFTLL